jgi:hypothetical protein
MDHSGAFCVGLVAARAATRRSSGWQKKMKSFESAFTIGECILIRQMPTDHSDQSDAFEFNSFTEPMREEMEARSCLIQLVSSQKRYRTA